MAGKKSPNGSRSKPAERERRRAPMREFSRSLPMSLLRAREAVMRQFRPSLRNHGLTEQQWRILRALTAVDTIEVTELARVAFLLGPSLSRILRDLEARASDRAPDRRSRSAPRRGVDLGQGTEADRGGRADVGSDLCRDHQPLSAPASSPNCRTCWARSSAALRRWRSPARATPRQTSEAQICMMMRGRMHSLSAASLFEQQDASSIELRNRRE